MECDKTTTVSLLDYFAAHAPAVPHWFKHENPEKEPRKPLTYDFFRTTYKHGEILKTHFNEEEEDETGLDELFFTEIPEIIRREILSDLALRKSAWAEYFDIHPIWEQKDKMLRITQWRFAYAKAMIAEKNK